MGTEKIKAEIERIDKLLDTSPDQRIESDYSLASLGVDYARALLEEIERLRAVLEDALEGMQDMVPYVPDYFRQKWGHQGYVDRASAALKEAPDA